MAENKRLPPGKTTELKPEHEDIQTAFGYRNAVEMVSEIAQRLEAVNGERNTVATATPGQAPVNDPTRPPVSESSCPDIAQQGDLGLQLNQLAGNLAANLEGLKVAGSLIKSASRQLSAGIQQFNAGMKGMKQGLSNFKLEDECGDDEQKPAVS